MTPGLQAKVQAARQIEQTLTVSAADADKLALAAWQAVCSHPDFRELDNSDQAAGLTQLAHHHHAVGVARRDLRAIDNALGVLEQAGKLVSDDPDQVLDHHLQLIPVLISRFRLSDERRYLDRALQLGERCLAYLDTASPTAITCRHIVANALWYAYEERQRPEDLASCIAWLLPTVPTGRFDLWHARDAAASLVKALVERAATGDRADLEQAVVLGRRIVTEVPEEGSSSEHIAVLVRALLRRFAVTGDRSNLRDAIGWTRRAASGPGGVGVRARAALVCLLLLWWRHSGDLQALNEAVGRQLSVGVASAPFPPADGNSFNAVIADATIGLPPLSELLREALDLPQLGPELQVALQCQLAVELRSRFGRTDDHADLDQAVEAAKRAVASARGLSPPLGARAHLELGECLRARFHRSLSRGYGIVFGPSEDLRGAFAAYRAACEAAETDSPVIVLRAARQWAPWAADYGEVSEAALAYSHGLRAFHQLLRRPSNAQQRVAVLFEGLGLSTRAAYALAAVGYMTGALLALEAGRAVVTFQHRLGELGAAGQQAWAATDLAVQRYQRDVARRQTSDDEELRRQVEALAEAMLDPAEGSTVPDAPATEVPSESDAWYRPIARLQAAVTSTSQVLIYLVASGKGGMCLMVRRDGVQVRWLPRCTEHSVRRQVVELYDAYRLRHTDRHQQQRFRLLLDEVGRWLWVAVFGELLEACAEGEHLVLVPTGLLSLLPLNVAWRPDATQPAGRRYAVDQVEWVVVPNGRAWLDATAAAAVRPIRSALVVDSPEPTTFPSLGYSAAEARAVERALPGAEILSGSAATVDSIVHALTGTSLTHFSCHGVADPLAPERSGIVLSGNALLRAGDLLEIDLSGCRLAVLSACESAAIDQELPDEVFGLPAALLSAGVPGVVGALWNVPTSSALFLAIGLYQRLQAGQLSPPACFREALRWLRDSTNQDKARALEAVMDVAGSTELASLVRRLQSAPDATWFAEPTFWAPFLYMGV